MIINKLVNKCNHIAKINTDKCLSVLYFVVSLLYQ